MTNSEYIFKSLGIFGVSQEVVDVMLLDSDVDGSAACDINTCKAVIANDFHLVRACAHRSVSEGGFSLSFNECEKALKDFEKSLKDHDEDGKIGGYGCIDKSYIW